MNWIELANQTNESLTEIYSFDEYFDVFLNNPRRESRTTGQYFKDMFDYFGESEDGFALFARENVNSPGVYGQKIVQKQIYQNLLNFIDEGLNNKFILLVGPNGSSKSSLIRKMMEAAEDYSRSEEGPLYSFSWIFPVDNYVKGHLGLGDKGGYRSNKESFAHLEEKDIASILNSELKDSPLLLIPRKVRQTVLENALKDDPERLKEIKKTNIYNGDLSKRNRMIFDALLQGHQGDYNEVLRYVRVERFAISKRYSSAAVTIEPQLHVDARMQQITMDKRLGSLPPGIQSLNLFSMHGEVVMANRGILEYSDLLKRPLDTFKYLLMTMESKNINLNGVLTELDIFFTGSSNEIHLSAFRQHPDFQSFKGRINFIKVPYLLSFVEEEKIYKPQVESLKSSGVEFSPHALETLCMWAVMTRIRQPIGKNYEDKKMSTLIPTLTPLEKILLVGKNIIPSRFHSEDRQTLRHARDYVVNEFDNDKLYEGKFGISPREIKQILYEVFSDYKLVTFVEVLDFLVRFIDRKNEYDFLNIAPQGEYHNPLRSVEALKEYQLEQLDCEVRDSLGMVDDRSYEDYIQKYIQSIICLMKGEKIHNPILGKFEEVDQYFIKEFENNIKMKEEPVQFRSHLISALGAYSLDNPSEKITYTNVFPDIVSSLKESFKEEQKKIIHQIGKNLVYFVKESETGIKQSSLTEEARLQIMTVLSEMKEKFHYSENSSVSLIKFLLKERY